MIKIEKIEAWGFEGAIRGMRNPLNSWHLSDSWHDENENFIMGEKDYNLAHKLARAGSDHRKFMRQIFVSVDITAPLHWWKQFDTYKVSTVSNSCSTMHKIHDKEFSLSDFSHEHLLNYHKKNNNEVMTSHQLMFEIIRTLNHLRDCYLESKDKEVWRNMIDLLPSSYNQKRTVTLNYETLVNLCASRKNHKLKEWNMLIEEFEKLPYSSLFIVNKKGEKNGKK